jgi:hydroxypyruvate reductase
VNAAVLKALGPDGYAVNVSRGSTVDETALCEAIEAGELAGTGLDVFENEPGVSDRLRVLDRVILTPHVAAKTRSAQHAQQELLLANPEAFFAGHPVLTPVC